MLQKFREGAIVEFTYTNYKGETDNRKAVFKTLQYGSNHFHTEDQMYLACFCLDRNAFRSFAIKDISNFRVIG